MDPWSDAVPAPPESPDRWRTAAADAWSVVARCLAILALLGVVAVVVASVTSGGDEALGGLQIVAVAWLVHAAFTLVIGYPVGWVVSGLLPERPSRARASWTYALVGGVTGALIIAVWGIAGTAPLIWGGLGAVTAGSARVWADGVIRARAARALAARAWPPPSTPAAPPTPHTWSPR